MTTEWRPGPRGEGLSFLLPAVRYPPGKGLTIAVRGYPGAGKTIVSLWLALSAFLDAGGRMAIFDLEQGEWQTRELLKSLRPEWVEKGVNPVTDIEKMLYVDARVMTKQILIDYVQQIAAEWEKSRAPGAPPDIIVVDSINGVRDGPFEREELERIRFEAVEKGVWLLATCESGLGIPNDHRWLEFVADIVLLLGTELKGSYSRRTIEVLKCRNTAHIRGKHVFSLSSRDPMGGVSARLSVKLYPSLAARLSKWEWHHHKTDRTGEKESLRIEELDTMVANVPRRSATAYVGTRACRKTPCALHFALPGVRQNGDCGSGRTLIVSLGLDEGALAAIASDYKALAEGLLETRPALRFRGDLVEFYAVRPGYVSPEVVVQRVNRILREKKDIDRAVVTDICQLAERLPLLKDDPAFLAAMVELFRVHEVSALFVESAPRGAMAGTVLESSIASLVDNVIEFRHLFFYGSDHIGVTVRRRHGAKPEAGFRELRDEWDGGKQIVKVERNLDDFTGLFSDAPRLCPITLFLYHSNEVQKEFNNQMDRMVRAAFPGLNEAEIRKIPVNPRDASFHLFGLRFATGQPQPDVRVAMLDEFWVRHLGDRLAPMTEEIERELPKSIVTDADRRSYPHYLNVGVFASFDVETCRALKPETDLKGWQAFDDWAAEKAQPGSGARAVFGFDASSPESWSSMLLEVLASVGTFDSNTERIRVDEDESLNELLAFRSVFWRGRDLAVGLKELRRAHSATTIAEERRDLLRTDRKPEALPLLFRCWYSDLTAFVKNKEAGDDVSIASPRIFAVPGGRGMRGEWAWGVSRSSRNVSLGWRLVGLLSSEEMATRKYEWGVGLPATVRFYNGKGAYMSVDPTQDLAWVRASILEPAVSRRQIANYPIVAPLLQGFLYDLLTLPVDSANVRAEVTKLASRYQVHIDRAQDASMAGS